MNLICINDDYSIEHLIFFAKYGLKYPKNGEKVEVLRKVKYSFGSMGLIISPYDGQFAPTNHHGIESQTELSFLYTRFAHLDGTPLLEEEIKNLNKKKILI